MSSEQPHPFPSQNMRQTIKLALSLVLFYAWGLWSDQDFFNYGALAIVLCSMGTRGATIEKGIARVAGTTFGVLVGFAIMALFNHDRWALMLAFVCYLVFVSYFMQGSRNSYAWYVAAFVPLVVWGDNFPNFDGTFNFITFRWLETTVGILLYTVIDMLLWPQRAGDQLEQHGQTLWDGAADLLADYRRELKTSRPSENVTDTRKKVAGARDATFATLPQAFLDTPSVAANQAVWLAYQRGTETLLDSLDLWHQSITDVRLLDLGRLLPQLDSALQTLETRVARIGVRYGESFLEEHSADGEDHDVTTALNLEIDPSNTKQLSHSQLAALTCFCEQLKSIDQSSRRVLHCVRALADFDPVSDALTDTTPEANPFRPKPWIKRRFIHALYPSVAFVLAFLFWIYWDPPTGAKVPMFAGILSLAVLRTPLDPRILVVALLLSIFLTLAPVYWLLMPRLETGTELLLLIACYTLLFGWLGGYHPLLKVGPMVEFVMASGISNQQRYSFQGPVDGALLTVMGGIFCAIAYVFFSSLRPEVTLLGWQKRFFAGCAEYINALSPVARGGQHADRRQILESMVVPAPDRIQTAQKKLDFKRYPDNPPEKLEQLHACIQSISYRLQSLEIAIEQAASRAPKQHEALIVISQSARESVRDLFRRWARYDSDADVRQHEVLLQNASAEIQSQFAAIADTSDPPLNEQSADDLYAIVGVARGLIEAMTSTQQALKQINWQQLAAPRF